MSLTQKLFSFDGRIRRRDWWLLGIALGVVSFIVQFAIASAMGVSLMAQPPSQTANIISLAIGLVFLWPSLALGIKRGHDRNRPAIIMIVFYALVVLMQVLTLVNGPQTGTPEMTPLLMAVGAVGLIVVIYAIYILIDYGFLDGTPGPNRYGESPKALGGSAEAFN